MWLNNCWVQVQDLTWRRHSGDVNETSTDFIKQDANTTDAFMSRWSRGTDATMSTVRSTHQSLDPFTGNKFEILFLDQVRVENESED